MQEDCTTNMQEYLLPGTFLQGNRYRIVRFIASGGFGCTYEGVHVSLGKRVAIKEFFVKDFCNRDAATGHITVGTFSRKPLVDKLREKFINEAKGLCEFNHPGIVNVSDIFEENGTAYFVMDYIDGASLNQIVEQRGAMSEAEAVGYIRQVADALRKVHSRHRLHLDIKPGNIMLDKDNRAVLIDFGASKQYDSVAGQNTSTLLGYTCGYAPPEQMSNSVKNFHACTDLYALGATLYKLVTGETPPDSMTILSYGGFKIPDSVSPVVANAISTAMNPMLAKRPQNIDEFLALLSKNEARVSEPTERESDEPTVFIDSPIDSDTMPNQNRAYAQTAMSASAKISERFPGQNPEQKNVGIPNPQKSWKKKSQVWIRAIVAACVVALGMILLYPIRDGERSNGNEEQTVDVSYEEAVKFNRRQEAEQSPIDEAAPQSESQMETEDDYTTHPNVISGTDSREIVKKGQENAGTKKTTKKNTVKQLKVQTTHRDQSKESMYTKTYNLSDPTPSQDKSNDPICTVTYGKSGPKGVAADKPKDK